MDRIRTAGPADAAFIQQLAARFAECELPPWRTAEEISGGTAAQLLRAIERGNTERSAVFVAERDGARVGFAWVLMNEDFYTGEPIGKVSEIAVERSGDGVGAALMTHCEQWAKANGARLMTLNALEGNKKARRFYERLGYAPEYSMFAKRL